MKVADPRDPEGERTLEVEYKYTSGSSGSYYEPPDPGEVEITGIFESNEKGAPDIGEQLTDDQIETITQTIFENVEDDYGDEPDDLGDD